MNCNFDIDNDSSSSSRYESSEVKSTDFNDNTQFNEPKAPSKSLDKRITSALNSKAFNIGSIITGVSGLAAAAVGIAALWGLLEPLP